jgi:uncharacterized protein (TIGR03000 family)
MRRALLLLACGFVFALPVRGGEIIMPDGSPLSQQGGLIIMRQGGQTTISIGGALLPRNMRVITPTPEGPVVTRFTLPSNFCSPTMPEWLGAGPAFLHVEIPDADGHLYIEDTLTHAKGSLRYLQSPPLLPGEDCTLQLRAVFMVGDRILVEDKTVKARAGECTAVKFTGEGARVVSVRR